MKIKSGFVVRAIAGESVVVAVGEASKSFKGIIKLNDTGRVLWDALALGADEADLLTAITSEYDVDPDTAKRDIDKFRNTLRSADILE